MERNQSQKYLNGLPYRVLLEYVYLCSLCDGKRDLHFGPDDAEFYAEADYPLDEAWATAAFDTLLRHDAYGAVWIVWNDGAPAGYIVLTVRFSMEVGGIDAFIDDLFVRPAHRRRGVGRLAMASLFDECRRRGVLAVHVEVGHDNAAANALYTEFGLRPRSDNRVLLTTELGDTARVGDA